MRVVRLMPLARYLDDTPVPCIYLQKQSSSGAPATSRRGSTLHATPPQRGLLLADCQLEIWLGFVSRAKKHGSWHQSCMASFQPAKPGKPGRSFVQLRYEGLHHHMLWAVAWFYNMGAIGAVRWSY